MFTGLVEKLALVRHVQPMADAGITLEIAEPSWVSEIQLGESIAVNGACLTVVEILGNSFKFQVGPETLIKTNLKNLKPNDRVNLERSLRVGDRLGGHFVQGHVDCLGSVESRTKEGEWEILWFRAPREITRLMVPRGSIAVDGISLTVVNVEPERFQVMLIPHTLEHTTLGFRQIGDAINLEADMLAKHVQKLLENR
ncbi:riboflavin synthase [Telmatocola sphagniphila]|uniref:Riboflavin synthase n=1 Tax=Telmatocola sphagniphila TaxID=1123043 RepID=A0A8E6B6U8_9BACT|nr:riboflavin synthase [Telmatocola sphagniphila]QVL32447.1 riboflavin synthase [Telmatocola sphagniphila]